MAAYDGYRSQPDHHQAPYSSSYDPSYDSRSFSSSYHQNAHYHEPPSPRSRASSNAPSDGLPQPGHQPLNNALSNAFDRSDTARTVDPDLIAQITAEVKRSVLDEIKLNGVDGVTGQAQPTPPQHIPQSPTSTSASFHSRNVYTPPSPKHHDYSSHGSDSPDPLARDSMFDGSGDTPTPRHERSAPVDIPTDRAPRSRPPPAQRMSQEGDFTPIEKMWQRLFDPQGQPVPRLGQFLRGLAVYLIDDYEPKKSLVISPSKMLKFYNDVKLPEEIYPWHSIFGRLSYPKLCKIYREMRCQHHLIQEHSAGEPRVPALTPEGFQEWMTTMIQAYPDNEYKRLSKAVLDLPISNADDAKERFPKELPRRLFPYQENLHAQQRCAAALSAEGVGPLRKAPTFPPPPPMGPSSGPTPGLDRERSPYATQPDSRAIESDDDETPLSMPLERERKPYSSVPGGGKIYEDGLSRSMQSDTVLHSPRHRTQSTASQSQWVPPTIGSHHQNHPRTGSHVNSRRPRSPSFSNYGTRSDPSVRDIPGSYFSSNMYDSEEENRRFAKDAEMKRNDWARRQAEEDSSGVPRRSTMNSTDNSYSSQARPMYDTDYYRDRGGSNGYDDRGYEPRRY
ncbi:uncharacterized protein BDR25DRAFT_298052 [Lindgomyces ingoldianus]|uniref:Uncharacterized protein n=1 Tax=Lindgomyces ingoldianus TaxID=673940 RepID=A0ACB6Q949_9PLEO|nr:uncharacterized protein BDR25DRAFT_298052 [Lindgomyces ingoldianus]KAF2463488.1 hypothetical protein BDR25DRAFT_298052 [Lindgomyces ingoldianus]